MYKSTAMTFNEGIIITPTAPLRVALSPGVGVTSPEGETSLVTELVEVVDADRF